MGLCKMKSTNLKCSLELNRHMTVLCITLTLLCLVQSFAIFNLVMIKINGAVGMQIGSLKPSQATVSASYSFKVLAQEIHAPAFKADLLPLHLKEIYTEIQEAMFIERSIKTMNPTIWTILKTTFFAAREKGVDPFLILAIIQHESDFNPKAFRKDTEVYGLMQIRFPIWKNKLDLKLERLTEIEYNIKHGVQILKEYMDNHPINISLRKYGGSFLSGNESYEKEIMSKWENFLK
jgi:hypothetical protein